MSNELSRRLDEALATVENIPTGDDTNPRRRPALVEQTTTDLLEATSWRPIPIPLSGGDDDDRPTLLPVRNGTPLLYEGTVNALYGETESGKTWIALHAAEALLRSDPTARVLWIDYESSAPKFGGRCRAFSLDPELIERIDYINPRHPISNPKLPGASSEHYPYLRELVEVNPYRLAVVDTMTGALSVEGLDPNVGTDIETAYRWLFRTITANGAAVLVLDHVTKSGESRGKYAIGSERKLSVIDGAAYFVEVARPWSRATVEPIHGSANIRLAKDRPGHVRAGRSELSTVAVVEVTATPDGLLDVRVVSPLDTVATPPIDLLREVIELVRADGPITTERICKQLGGKRETVRGVVAWLRHDERRALVGEKRGAGTYLTVDEQRLRELDLL